MSKISKNYQAKKNKKQKTKNTSSEKCYHKMLTTKHLSMNKKKLYKATMYLKEDHKAEIQNSEKTKENKKRV